MIIYLDTETTGLRPGNICQLSYVIQEKDSVRAKNFFFQVDFIEYSAFIVHGFSVEKLKELSGGKRFSDCLEEIELDFNQADYIICHNTSFDFMFLRAEFEKCSSFFAPNNEFCTMKQSTCACKLPRSSGVGYKYPKLAELVKFLGITDKEILSTAKNLFGFNCGYHDARFDACAVYLAVNKAIGKIEQFDVLAKHII